MKEININIEGYNVNGICVGCLNYNRTMFYHEDVKECFRILANIDVPDGLIVQVCWECLARVKGTLNFRAQMLAAYDCLINYSREHTFLDSPSDLSTNAYTRLSVCKRENIEILPSHLLKDEVTAVTEVKVEFDEKVESIIEIDQSQPLNIEQIEESLKPKLELDIYDTNFPSRSCSPLNDKASSDDDIVLSNLKSEKKLKKSKRDRKSVDKKEPKKEHKKQRRRLPEDVEEYTMTDMEMWTVRERDRTSAEFLALKHTCAACLLCFQTNKKMEYHMTGKHGQQPAGTTQCDVCTAYFSEDHYPAHRFQHLNAMRCRKCDFMTTMKRLMKLHLHKQHEIDTPYPCKECGTEFSTKSKLNYHKVQCSVERPQCDCCGKVFANKITLRQHLKPVTVAGKHQKPAAFFPCKGCDKVFLSRKSYKAHAVIHDNVSYPCPTCGKLFRWKRNLSRHTRNHRERASGAAHRCRECAKSFASRDCLNNHLRLSKRHVGDSAYIHACHYCGKKFATKWCMVDHIDWEHLKRIKYQCRVCFKAFKTAKILVAHVQNIHDGKNKKPDSVHLCEICGKSYKSAKRLKGHVWAMHTMRSQSKTFRCTLCPATFVWKTSIYKHMKIMHDGNRRKTQRAPPKKLESYPDMEVVNCVYLQTANLVQMTQPTLSAVPNL